MTITARTALYGVIGDPIVQSYSPLIHNFWLKEAAIDAVYGAYHLRSENASADIEAARRLGLQGLNVTMPHKQAAFAAAAEKQPAAAAIGVANTLVKRPDGQWAADNTDAEGFLWGLSEADEGALSGRTVLVIGAGGASRAVVYALRSEAADLVILNRTAEKASALAGELAPEARTGGLEDLKEALEAADIVVNATSWGYGGDTAPDLSHPGRDRLFYDLSYGPAAEPILAAAAKAGWRTQDGLAMLVGQAAEAFRIWFGVEPDRDAALALCRAAEASRA